MTDDERRERRGDVGGRFAAMRGGPFCVCVVRACRARVCRARVGACSWLRRAAVASVFLATVSAVAIAW